MPEYKKKKTHSKKRTNSKVKNSPVKDNHFNIKMKPKSAKSADIQPVKVIKGKKLKVKFRLKALGILAGALLLFYLLSFLIFPVGLGETFNNLIKPIGSGEYPLEISGTSVLDVVSMNNYYYTLTDSALYTVNHSGKVINTFSHGYSAPVIKTSKTRALIFDCGQNNLSVYALDKKIVSKENKLKIICADISDSGAYAVAFYGEDYTSVLKVYNKKGKEIFTFNCAKDLISTVSISPNGKKVLITTVNAQNGDLKYTLRFFNVKKTDPEKVVDLSDKTVLNTQANSKGVYVITNKGCTFEFWRNKDSVDTDFALSVDTIRNTKSGAILLLNTKGNKNDNKIVYLTKKGEKKYEFSFNGIVSDIRLSGSHIYIISESRLYIYDIKGKLIGSSVCDFMYKKLGVTGAHSIVGVSDSKIKDFNIN